MPDDPLDMRARREELGAFLRARRAEVQPDTVGIVPFGRRRVTGLRRHEVADLAGVSDTWYTWLEQGREMRITPDMLDSVCRALGLSQEEWRYVRRLSGTPIVDTDEPDHVSADLLDSLRPLLEDLLPSAANLATIAWDILAWNASYTGLFGDPSLLPPNHRNWLWRWFMAEEPRRLRDWDQHSRHAVAWFRSQQSSFIRNPRADALVQDLLDASGEFRSAWADRRVQPFVSYAQTIDHPNVGEIHTNLIQLMAAERPPLLLMIQRPADPLSRDRMSRLAELAERPI
jgi:transcriptional regulator with XRE-family HTH domain